MRMVDSSLELVACGSSGAAMPTFGAWEATVLDHTYEYVDYISCHAYYQPKDGDLASFLASAVDMDGFIEAVVATADHVRARKRATKRIAISFDEWNVWYMDRFQDSGGEQDWLVAPRVIEDEYNAADAVVVGGLLISLLRHSDRVTAASLAQLVNVIAPIRAEAGGPAWRQTTFHPFALTARHAAGTVLTTLVDAPAVSTKLYGDVPAIDAVVTHDPDAGTLTVFAVNRDPEAGARLELDLRPFPGYRAVEHVTLAEPDLTLSNTQEHPDRVVPRDAGQPVDGDGSTTVVLPAASWNMVRLTARP